jgi:hypothetical protein
MNSSSDEPGQLIQKSILRLIWHQSKQPFLGEESCIMDNLEVG